MVLVLVFSVLCLFYFVPFVAEYCKFSIVLYPLGSLTLGVFHKFGISTFSAGGYSDSCSVIGIVFIFREFLV